MLFGSILDPLEEAFLEGCPSVFFCFPKKDVLGSAKRGGELRVPGEASELIFNVSEPNSGPFQVHFRALGRVMFGRPLGVFCASEKMLSTKRGGGSHERPRSSLWVSLGLFLAHFGVAGGSDLERT